MVATALERTRATTKRTAKRDALADLFRAVVADPADGVEREILVVVGFVLGDIRQGRIGLGWASVRDLVAGADEPSLTVADVDAAFTTIASQTGAGSRQDRHAILAGLFARSTPEEADLIRGLVVGDLRTGALEGVVTDAVARAAGLPIDVVRRATMFAGDVGVVAVTALVAGEAAVQAIGLSPLRGVQPMLASTSASVADAVAEVGEASVEWKLDGARIQVHRVGDLVRIFTRNLNDVTERLPEVVATILGFAAASFVLDGEVLGFMGPEQTPQAFQDTMSRFGRAGADSDAPHLVPQFFDLLHLDGVDVIDRPLRERRALLVDLVGAYLIPGVITAEPAEAESVLAAALDRGHEGVMVKAADSPYEAGRRGKSWRKVKPVHTLDLVVLAVEWGSGRRQGWLSNIHLGARDPETGEFVMVGKTFKGMTDAILEFQTERFRALQISDDGWVVRVRPEQVVEIAVDGVQASTRYPGGVALRFARVKGYRPDKTPAEVDTIATVRALLPRTRT